MVRGNKTCNNDNYLQIAKKTKGLVLLTHEYMLMALLSFVLYMMGRATEVFFQLQSRKIPTLKEPEMALHHPLGCIIGRVTSVAKRWSDRCIGNLHLTDKELLV